MTTSTSGCHTVPEKVTTRFRLCDGPTLVLQDVGPCGTTTPKYINDLSFRIFFGWAELVIMKHLDLIVPFFHFQWLLLVC